MNVMNFLRTLVCLGLAFVSISANAQWERYIPRDGGRDWERYIPKQPRAKNVNCSEMSGYKYCVQKNSASKILMVHLHGAGQTEESIFRTDKPDPIISAIKRSGAPMPTIVTISMGRFWWLGTHRGDQIGGAASVIEALIRDLRQKDAGIDTVVLYGVSMGGFNGLQVFMRRPSLFTRIVLSCPALIESNPFDDGSWDADPDAKAAKPFSRWGLRRGLQEEFSSSSNWSESNPMNLLKRGQGKVLRGQEILVTTVGNDGFGFINTPVKAAKMLSARGNDVTHLKTSNAEHCFPDTGPLVSFITK